MERSSTEKVTIKITMPGEMYEPLVEILDELGLTFEDTLVRFLEYIVQHGRLPFDYTEEELRKAEAFGPITVEGW